MITTRLDRSGRLGAKHRTHSGAVRVPANLTRVGVFTYRRPDGSTSRELRHPDDVMRADSYDTLTAAAVTVGHPAMVSPETWRSLSVGHPTNVRKDGRFVVADLVVHDPGTIARIDSGELVELSCGYDCELVPERGTYDGETYDSRQTNIRYNHVGLLPAGTGRAGAEVSLKFDAIELEHDTRDGYGPCTGLVKDPRFDRWLEEATRMTRALGGR